MDLGKVSKITRGGYAKAQDDVQNYAPLPKLRITPPPQKKEKKD